MTAKEAITTTPAVKSEGGLLQLVNSMFEWFGGLGIFSLRTIRAALTPPFEGRELMRQMDAIGAKSLPLVALAGAAIGAVLSMQTRDSLVRFGAKSVLPIVIVISIIKESGPIITALVMSGRVGAGIGAELGSMKVSEQIDAIEASAVNPHGYLAATRILACMLMLPLLTIVADFCGIVMGWVANTIVDPIPFWYFMNAGFEVVRFQDLFPSLFKAVVFGLIIGLIGCFQGMRASGGTEGVGRASTSAVVLSSLFVILADVVLVRLIITLFP
jgi:phospholipid/cholesterol/gamma-HCH transport system permease protein